MKVAVIGAAGSIGSRHLQNLKYLGLVPWAIDIANGTTIEDLNLDDLDAAIIATPADSHVPLAMRLAEAGIALFIEKPLALSVADAKALLDADVMIQVGYNLRQLSVLRKLHASFEIQPPAFVRFEFGQDLRSWRPRDYRETPSAKRELGGGILLEASHELDLINWLLPPWVTVSGWTGITSDLGLDVEDTALAHIGTIDGGIVELHLDMCQAGYRREILLWDQTIRVDRDQIAPSYLHEIGDFLENVRQRRRPECGTEEGIAALELVEAIKKSSATGNRVVRSEAEFAFPDI